MLTSNALVVGAAVTSLTYAYNQAGVSGKLPGNFGFVHPASTTAVALGAVGFLATMATKKPSNAIPFVAVAGAALQQKALSNSLEDVRKEKLALPKSIV